MPTVVATTNPMTQQKTVLDKLVTKEDPFHVHKTLGLACLFIYAVRFYHYYSDGRESDCFFATHPQYTLPTFILHVLLNLTSLIFDIPQKRISSGYRIWPEYRWHSLIFLCYTLLVMTCFWVEDHYEFPRLHFVNYVITMLVMAAADLASWSVGHTNQSNSIRQLEAPASVKIFFSWAQFIAKATLMYTPSRRYSTFYFFALIIQVNAFMMTLRRKNVFPQAVLVGVYGLLLTIGLYIIFTELFVYGGGWMTCHVILGMACISFLLRAGPRFPKQFRLLHNKYIIWTIMGAILNLWFLPRFNNLKNAADEEKLYQVVKSVSFTSLILVILFAYHKLSDTGNDSKKKAF